MTTNAKAELHLPRWRRFRLSTLFFVVTAIAVALAWFAREAAHDRQKQEMRMRAYADRATLLTEAAARLRAGDTPGAIAYLEQHADQALHGVPNWRKFDDVPPAGQFALAQAKVYRSAYPTKDAAVNWYLRDVPPLPMKQRSTSLKKLSANGKAP